MSEQDLPYLIIAIVRGLFLLFIGIIIFISVFNFFGGLFFPEIRDRGISFNKSYKMIEEKRKAEERKAEERAKYNTPWYWFWRIVIFGGTILFLFS